MNKTTIPAILAALGLLSGGCATSSLKKLDAQIPDGVWEQAAIEVTGKFTSTTLDATGVKRGGKWVRGEVHFTHNNPWVTKATVDLKVKENEE
jgi:hypothetical protein